MSSAGQRNAELRDHDRVLALHLVDAVGEIGEVDRRLVLDGLDQLLALGRVFLARGGDGLAACIGGAVLRLGTAAKRFAQEPQRRAGIALHQQVGLDLLERIAGDQRIGRDVDDLGVAPRTAGGGNPRDHAVEHDHDVGLLHPRAGLEAEMHGVVGRQVEVARLGLHDRDCEFVGELAELDHGRRVAPDGRGHDQREFGLGDHRRRFLDDAARRLRRGDRRADGYCRGANASPDWPGLRAAASGRPGRAARSS